MWTKYIFGGWWRIDSSSTKAKLQLLMLIANNEQYRQAGKMPNTLAIEDPINRLVGSILQEHARHQ